jgi:hypothetical protein
LDYRYFHRFGLKVDPPGCDAVAARTLSVLGNHIQEITDVKPVLLRFVSGLAAVLPTAPRDKSVLHVTKSSLRLNP